MSVLPEIIQILNQVYNKVFFTQQEPSTILVPVSYQTFSSNDNEHTILMDHERLPAAQEVTMSSGNSNERTFFGHNLNNEFIYEGATSSNNDLTSEFHLIGDPGMFLVGPNYWWVGPGLDPAIPLVTKLIVTISADGYDLGPMMTTVTGNEKVPIFLSKGDNFSVHCFFEDNTALPNEFNLYGFTDYTITRLSRNKGQAFQIPEGPS
jgi:hypothetical protein